MENTTALDSNSESDISDGWALIDEDYSLEWNNEMDLSPRKFILEKNENDVSRTCSRNELSDEDSIEVVADDHTDCLSDNEADGLKDKLQSIDLLENVDENKDIPVSLAPSVQNVPDRSETVAKYKPSPAIIMLFLLGVVGGITVGYSLAIYLQPLEDSSSIQSTRALLAKLQNENLLLQHQLHHARSLQKATANFPEFKATSNLSFHKKPLRSSNIVDYDRGLCKITDFILQSQFSSSNISNDVCLPTDEPWEDKVNIASNLLDVTLLKNNLDVQGTSKNTTEHNPNEEYHSLQMDEPAIPVESRPSVSDSLVYEHLYHKNAPQDAQSFESKSDRIYSKSSETGTDPKPFTKAREIVEKVYRILSMLGQDIPNSFPSKVELLRILRQDDLDFSVGSFSSDSYSNIITFKNQMQITAQKMLNDIESSLNNFFKNIASKFKKFETNNTRQICKLRRRLENGPDKSHVDSNKPIFQKCVDYRQNGQNDAKHKHRQMRLPDSVLESKDSMGQIKPKFEYKESYHMNYGEQKQVHDHDMHHPKENKQRTSTVNENLKFNEEKREKSSKTLPTFENSASEKDKWRKYDDDGQEKEKYLKHKHNHIKHDKQRKKWKEDGLAKEDIGDNVHNRKHEAYDKRKIYEEKERKEKKINRDFDNRKYEKYDRKMSDEKEKIIESNKGYKMKPKDKKNVHEDNAYKSGEWMEKMAHGRAEQRRRDHQSDWVFDRAESRKSSRGKDKGKTYWYERQTFSESTFNSNMCNKTKPFKEQATKAWKDVKHHVKEHVWRPVVDTAKTAKRVFNNMNYLHSRQE